MKFIFLLLLTTFLGAKECQVDWISWYGFKEFRKNPQTLFVPNSSRIFLSLSAKEIQWLSEKFHKNRLEQLLNKAHENKRKVMILLGDATFVYPSNHQHLLHLITFFQQFAFDGVAFDIEPSALPKEKREIWYENIVPLMQKVQTITKKPTTFFLHHSLATKGFLKQLHKSGMNEIAIMYYSINQKNLLKKMKNVLEYSDINLFLVVSIEPVGIVKKDETFATISYEKASQRWCEIVKKLQSFKNFRGVIVQSLDYYQKDAN